MQTKKLLMIIVALIVCEMIYAQKTITVDFQYWKKPKEDTLIVTLTPLKGFVGDLNAKTIKLKIDASGHARLVTEVSGPISLTAGFPPTGDMVCQNYIFEPGDSLLLKQVLPTWHASGIGAEKFELYKVLSSVNSNVSTPPVYYLYVDNLQQYNAWIDYTNRVNLLMSDILEKYKGKLSDFVWNTLKIMYLNNAEYHKLQAWGALCFNNRQKKPGAQLSNEFIAELFDRSMYTDELVWMRKQTKQNAQQMTFITQKLNRDAMFSKKIDDVLQASGDAGSNLPAYTRLLIEEGKKTYSGDALNAFLADMLSFLAIKNGAYEMGFPPEYDSLFNEYFAGDYKEEYKSYVKDALKYYRERRNGEAVLSSYLSLPDDKGKLFEYKKLLNKSTIVYYWKTGITSPVTVAALKRLQQKYSKDTSIVFVSVSADANKKIWLKNLRQQNYLSNAVNLFTNGEGDKHHVLETYGIAQYPAISVFKNGKTSELINTNMTAEEIEEKVGSMIDKHLTSRFDGPYVLKENGKQESYSVDGELVNKSTLGDKPVVQIHTDKPGITFSVNIRKNLRNEASAYDKPEKLLSLSDIEGNFDAFRKLLQKNNVIDENFNWIFGKGHLVFAGDMFDRGDQVTECLWLMYSLEEKAKAAGGYVHFVLGNHEIMNLSGNMRYVHEKYKQNATRMGKSYNDLFKENTILGEWLRTKNVIEKIGDILFVHGGISKEMNALPISLNGINELARPYYDKDTVAYKSSDSTLKMIYGNQSPFWYRGYYEDENGNITCATGIISYTDTTMEHIVDAVLKRFQVKHIVTGHTVVTDIVSAHYNNKVINTDTKHRDGKSEALLVEQGQYYRVNDKGQRVLLFKEVQ